MTPTLVYAKLYYGIKAVPVTGDASMPVPQEFDMSDAEGCARKIAAMMSNASGGFTLNNVRCAINEELGTVTVTGHGASVYFKDEAVATAAIESTKSLSTEERVALTVERMERTKVMVLGNVATNQYGNGWKNPVWTES